MNGPSPHTAPVFALSTADGVELRARWLGTTHQRPSTAVVLVHGFSASMDHPDVVAVADALGAGGYAVLTYDARGHHGSGGLCTLGDRERHDVSAAVAVARSRADRVVTVGASMGGIAVIGHAAREGGVEGVVAVSAPARWKLPANGKAVAAAVLTRTAVGRRLAARLLRVRIDSEWADPPSPEESASTLEVPLAIIHGDRDTIVPAGEARRLALAAKLHRLEIVAGMGHAYHRLGIPAILDAVAWTLAADRPCTA